MQKSKATSNSGIVGNKVPPSVRKDGTVRKEIKVKPGYIPQEDVSAFVSSKKHELQNTIPGTSRRRDEVKSATKKPSSSQNAGKSTPKEASKTPAPTQKEAKQETAEKDVKKQIRGLEKKLRQILELEAKPDLSPEEQEKVAKKSSIQDELATLSGK